MIDYGLVKRAECACGLVIIIPGNAEPREVAGWVTRHNNSAQHRAYYGSPIVAYPRERASGASETPSASPPSDEHRSGLTSRGADQGRDEEVISPPSRDGVSFRRDGYDFTTPRPSRRDSKFPPLCIPTPDCPHGYPYCGVCEDQPDDCD